MKDRRSDAIEEPIPEDLLTKGRSQLEAEISIIEGWLSDLDETREDNPESILARTTYTNMLLNRRELLSTLKQK